MKEFLSELWNEYYMEKCAVLDTEEEKRLIKKAADLHDKANAILNEEQKAAVEEYVETLSDIEAVFVKKAFFKGCGVAVGFILSQI